MCGALGEFDSMPSRFQEARQTASQLNTPSNDEYSAAQRLQPLQADTNACQSAPWHPVTLKAGPRPSSWLARQMLKTGGSVSAKADAAAGRRLD